MNEKNLKIIEILALTASGLVTVWAMLRAAAWSLDAGILLFALWAVSPYVCFYFADALLRKINPHAKMLLISCLTAILLLVSTLVLYVGTMNDTSSTYSLIFLAAPIYLYIGSFTLLAGNFIFWLLRKKLK